MKVNHSPAEPPLVQVELDADVIGERAFSSSDDHGREEQVELIDQAGSDRLSRKVGAAHREVTVRGRFSCRTASTSKSRSMRVLAPETSASVRE